ncbi:hypothetical protein HMPREF0044_0216 [Gleimia coleocanis DSM 15436]|uniref:Thioredoxin-like fold domain-containing protein n=1 Tax=Gleimia coleocanis DSM 15436 TaxID=525245 RepID=C0VYH6_9ACTO|nr:thioredoxin domain-containing protein [Gleimia coleocanis]EEH64479.1 hypothetical protein HMPREF0044_0216 [Gleimia coleocanis DSM 15436]
MANKVDSTRAKAEQLRAAQAKQNAKTRNILIAIVSALVAITVIASVWVVWSAKNKEAEVAAPGQVTSFLVSKDGIGKETPGLPTVHEYFDYSCHACADVDSYIGESVTKAAMEGKYNLVLSPVTVVDMPWHRVAAHASYLAYTESPENFVKLHHSLLAYFKTQFDASDASVIQNEAASLEQVKKLATEAGLPAATVEKISAKGALSYLTANSADWGAQKPAGRESLGTPEFQVSNKVVKLNGKSVEELYANFEKDVLAK